MKDEGKDKRYLTEGYEPRGSAPRPQTVPILTSGVKSPSQVCIKCGTKVQNK